MSLPKPSPPTLPPRVTPRERIAIAAIAVFYGVAAAVFVGVLVIAAWRQGDASAFRYVGF